MFKVVKNVPIRNSAEASSEGILFIITTELSFMQVASIAPNVLKTGEYNFMKVNAIKYLVSDKILSKKFFCTILQPRRLPTRPKARAK